MHTQAKQPAVLTRAPDPEVETRFGVPEQHTQRSATAANQETRKNTRTHTHTRTYLKREHLRRDRFTSE